MQPNKQYLIELAKAAQSGKSEAFDELYETLYTPLYRYIAAKVRTPEDAEDLTQAAMLKFYQNLPRWQDRGYSPTAYLYKIASTVVIDYYRATKNRPVGDSEEVLILLADRSQDLHKDVLEGEDKADLIHCMRQLGELDQEVLRLRFFSGLASDEVAKIIGKNAAATRKIQSRAIVKLRRLLEHHQHQLTEEQ